MKVHVLFFGKIAELGNTRQMMVENQNNIPSLITYLTTLFPKLKDMKFKIALNQTIITGSETLQDGDEIALLPPYSGG